MIHYDPSNEHDPNNNYDSNNDPKGELVNRFSMGGEDLLISYDLFFPEACLKHVVTTFRKSKVYIICSGSLARNTSSLGELQHALGNMVAGTRIGMRPHTFMTEVLETINHVRRVDADLIIVLGGGSLIDAAKVVAIVSTCTIYGLSEHTCSII